MYKRQVLIVAHGNSLRALVNYFDQLSAQEIMEVTIPTAAPLVYEFDAEFNVLSHAYLTDADELEKKADVVLNQGKVCLLYTSRCV